MPLLHNIICCTLILNMHIVELVSILILSSGDFSLSIYIVILFELVEFILIYSHSNIGFLNEILTANFLGLHENLKESRRLVFT